ncbi:MAG TPA: hypothetical protein VFB46_11450 [Gemmatimonadaceae bacterium]|nr:hypothetical protein [Gemmatimonadaceae bacterium]
MRTLIVGLFALALSASAAAQQPDSTAVRDSAMFSAAELYGAFSLTMSEDDAYRMTKAMTPFAYGDSGVKIRKVKGSGLSEDVLLLLSLLSDTTAAKVQVVRRAGRPSIPPDEEKRWMEKLEGMAQLAGGRKSP